MLDFHDDGEGVSARLHGLLDRWDQLRAAPPPAVRLVAVAVALVLVGAVAWRVLRPTAPTVDVADRIPIVGLDVTTTTAEPRPVLVHVVGAVAMPGVVELPSGHRIADAIEAAGGPTGDADLAGLNLAAPLVDGSQILVGRVGDDPPAGPMVTIGPSGGVGGGSGGPIDLNLATAVDLESLPGVGPATASNILGWREASGPFRTVDDLLSVPGIGPAKLDALRDLVVVR